MIGWWRRSVFSRLSRLEGFVRVLMMPRNGQSWSPADRAFLRAEVRAAARWVPAFLVFLLPGGMVLLPVYAWALDRRRGAALRLLEDHRRAEEAAAADPLAAELSGRASSGS